MGGENATKASFSVSCDTAMRQRCSLRMNHSMLSLPSVRINEPEDTREGGVGYKRDPRRTIRRWASHKSAFPTKLNRFHTQQVS